MSPNFPRADTPDPAQVSKVPPAKNCSAKYPAWRRHRKCGSAFDWFRAQEPQFVHWQMEMARIPAPPFGESARAAWLSERFREVGLDDVRIDDVGNVFGTHPGFGRRFVSLSAHIDTVFPTNTPLNIRQQGTRIYGPGVSDNGAGVTAMLAVAGLLGRCGFVMRCHLSLSEPFGEEGGG